MSSSNIRYIVIALAIAVPLAVSGIFMAYHSRRQASVPTKKQLWHCGMDQVIQDHPGDCPICHMALTPLNSDSSSAKAAEKKILYWWDPMLGTSSISDHPGTSAMGMEMVPVYANQGGTDVHIDPNLVQNMGVRTAKVTRGPLMKTVRTLGTLRLPEPGMHDVALKVGGWIDKLYANQDGMHVVKGGPLFDLYSQDLQVAEQELISAVKSASSLDASRSPTLRQEGQGLIDSAKRKLRHWDIAEEDIEAIAKADQPPKDVPFRSPASGHIEDRMIVEGSAVQAGMKLLRIADHTNMWLDAQVYQEQLSVVKPAHTHNGPEIRATIEGIPNKTFQGEIDFAYPHIDPMTRTLTVRITLKNPGFELRPGMYATVEIITQPVPDAIQVPREAVIDTGTRQIVFIAESEGHFTPRQVRMGIMGDNDMVQIDGVAPGETVVTSGQFLMDVESRTIEATQKLSAAAMTPPGDSQPSTAPVAQEPASLTQVFCPMAKADWLQIGDKVNNPYMGQRMSDCGEVRKKLPAPPAGSELSAFVNGYLAVAKAMDADNLERQAVSALKAAADALPIDRFEALREAAGRLADAKDLKSARTAYKAVSDQLIAVLQRPMK